MIFSHRLLPLLLIISPPKAFPFVTFRSTATYLHSMSASASNTNSNEKEYVRASDGIKLDYDPYAPDMAEKYGLPGGTDSDGFDPYADTVGPGIYGGSIQRDEKGNPMIGSQYQNHNSRPGPLYDGKGYSLIARTIQAGPEKVSEVLIDLDLKDDITTGGARPLHMCGMSKKGQLSTQVLIEAGADIHALDTYNYSALHRCASNDLEIGAEALVKAGADPNFTPPESDSSPMEIALRSRALKFLMAMQKLGHYE